MMLDMFDDTEQSTGTEELASGSFLLRKFAAKHAHSLLNKINAVSFYSPFRHMITPGGFLMSVAMSNCGSLGWITDEYGYRYTHNDPLTKKSWPAMPSLFYQLARQAAATVGYHSFFPDSCLINRYAVGNRMSLHQDKDEYDLTQPIVSISLGLDAVFQLGGMHRRDPFQRVSLIQGDVLVLGGESRLRFHGVLPIKHSAISNEYSECFRFNLTFRMAV